MMDPGIMFSEERLAVATNQATCSEGSRVIFNRIINILLDRLNALQPEEVDDEYLMRTSFNYDDYEKLLNYKKVQDCASLHGISEILTKILNNADIHRPREAQFLNMELQGVFIILFIVGLSSWAFQTIGYGQFKSTIIAITLVGFVQFLRQQKESNVGILFVKYFTELTFIPIGPFFENVGRGSQLFLSNFIGWNWILGTPIFALVLGAIVICFIFAFKAIIVSFTPIQRYSDGPVNIKHAIEGQSRRRKLAPLMIKKR